MVNPRAPLVKCKSQIVSINYNLAVFQPHLFKHDLEQGKVAQGPQNPTSSKKRSLLPKYVARPRTPIFSLSPFSLFPRFALKDEALKYIITMQQFR